MEVDGIEFSLQRNPPSAWVIQSHRDIMGSFLVKYSQSINTLYRWMLMLLIANSCLIVIMGVLVNPPNLTKVSSLSSLFLGGCLAIMAIVLLLRSEPNASYAILPGAAEGALWGAWIGFFYLGPYDTDPFSASEYAAVIVLIILCLAVGSLLSRMIGNLEEAYFKLSIDHHQLTFLDRTEFDDLGEVLNVPEVKCYLEKVTDDRRCLVNAESQIVRQAVNAYRG